MPRVKVEADAPVQLVLFSNLQIGETFRYFTQDYLKITSKNAFNFSEHTYTTFVSDPQVLPTTARLVVFDK
jgi:hypothetical protein